MCFLQRIYSNVALQEVAGMKGSDPVERRQVGRAWNRGIGDITKLSYAKWRASFSNSDEFVVISAENRWQSDSALLTAVALCIIISAMCGLAVMFLVVFHGLKALKKLTTGAPACCCSHLLACHAARP
jgi:hypothetical protein